MEYLFINAVIIFIAVFALYKVYGYLLYKSISNKTDSRFDSFIKTLGNNYSYKPEVFGTTKYKWRKNSFIITASFDGDGNLVDEDLSNYNFFSFDNRISFGKSR